MQRNLLYQMRCNEYALYGICVGDFKSFHLYFGWIRSDVTWLGHMSHRFPKHCQFGQINKQSKNGNKIFFDDEAFDFDYKKN